MRKRIIVCFKSPSDEEAKRRALFERERNYKYGYILTEYSRSIEKYYDSYKLAIRMVFENTIELK